MRKITDLTMFIITNYTYYFNILYFISGKKAERCILFFFNLLLIVLSVLGIFCRCRLELLQISNIKDDYSSTHHTLYRIKLCRSESLASGLRFQYEKISSSATVLRCCRWRRSRHHS